MKSKLKRSAFFLLVLVFLTACGAKESTDVKSDILGKWVSADRTLTLEFTSAQKINSLYETKAISNTISGDTVWLEDNVLLGVWEWDMVRWEVRIWGDKMELKSEDGRKLSMHRIKE